MTDPARPVVRLTLTPLPGCRVPLVALRRLLKALLRGFGWRCTRVEDLTPPPEAPSPHP